MCTPTSHHIRLDGWKRTLNSKCCWTESFIFKINTRLPKTNSPWRKGAVWPWMVCENCCLLEVDIQLRYDLKNVKAVTVITIILLRLLKCETWVEEMVHKNWQKASPEPTFTSFFWFCFFFLMPYYYLRNTELLKCLMFSSYNVSVFH